MSRCFSELTYRTYTTKLSMSPIQFMMKQFMKLLNEYNMDILDFQHLIVYITQFV